MDIAEAEKDEGAGMKVYIERTAVMNVLEQYYPGVNERLSRILLLSPPPTLHR